MPSLDYIKLDQFLKQMQVAASGGHAKVMVQGRGAGQRRGRNPPGRKLVTGDRVEVAGQRFVVDLSVLH